MNGQCLVRAICLYDTLKPFLTCSYFKTTLYGLSGCAPDYVMLMVGGNAGLIGMSKEHLGVALALNVPIAVCVTKVHHQIDHADDRST